jgi:kynurenine formamidase
VNEPSTGSWGALPDESEVLEYFDRYSNWNRWGSDDELGTLNFVTAEKRVEASRLVRSGAVASCARIVDTLSEPNDEMGPPQRFVTRTSRTALAGNRGGREGGASDYFGMIYHGVRVTHIDALSHVFWDDTAYNGVPADVVAVPDGARKLDVTSAKQGVFTRGLLVDAARFRGVDWMEAQQSVSGDEVRAILASEGLELLPGDALLLRTGYGKKLAAQGPDDMARDGQAGWHASCLPLFYEESISMIAADTTTDVEPSGYQNIQYPIHAVGIRSMGLWLVDNCGLEELAALCESEQRWEFALAVSVVPFKGLTGGPVNPLALF